MRVIGAETTGAGDLYWYVKANSPIKTLKDTDGKTLAYSTNGSSTHGVVTAFMRQYDLKAKPTAMGGPAANLTAVMSGQVDVGWAAPPFGLDQLDKGDIRRIATGNDAAVFKGQTVRLQHRQRELSGGEEGGGRALHEGVPRDGRLHVHGSEGLKTYAEWQNISLEKAQAHARRVLPAARDRARHHRRARHDREGCRDAEVHGERS